MFDADVLVFQRLRLFFCTRQHPAEPLRDVNLVGCGSRTSHLRQLLQLLQRALLEAWDVRVCCLQDRSRQPVVRLEQGKKQVLDVDPLMIAPRRQRLCLP
ncbi:hypothetical protein HRbin30_01354 [bacterium HR30]|nr:hypothetical protein HRbin30_01354 [bacterium HR30]